MARSEEKQGIFSKVFKKPANRRNTRGTPSEKLEEKERRQRDLQAQGVQAARRARQGLTNVRTGSLNTHKEENEENKTIKNTRGSKERPVRDNTGSKNTRILHRLEKEQRKVKLEREENAQQEEIEDGGINLTAFRQSMIWFSSTILVFACVFALGFGFYSFTEYVMSHPYFAIKEIKVSGAKHFTHEEIIQLSGIEEEENVFRVNLNNVESRMLQNPWIESIKIHRSLPDSFSLEVSERIPRFWVLHNNHLYYVDTKGQLIAPVGIRDFISLPMLDLGQSPELALRILPAFLEEMQRNSFNLPFTFDDIAWFRLSAGKGIEMFWQKEKIILSISVDDWQKNIKNLALVIRDLQSRRELGRTSEIYSGNGQVWFVPN